MSKPTNPRTFILRELPLAARLTLALFLISVGIGYLSALVQLHFQHATPGELLPTGQSAVNIFHGPTTKPVSTIERLLMAPEQLPFNGSGEMSRAFTSKSEGWKGKIKEKARELAKSRRDLGDAQLAAGEAALRKERDTERLALVEWVRSGASKTEYKQDRYCLPDTLAKQPMTEDYLVVDDGKPADPPAIKIKSLIQDRCARCHAPDGQDKAVDFPLDSYDHLKPYVTVQASGAMSLTKLAQTTHVHLLGFSMLYGLTGLILAFSSYPRFLRVLLCPLPLLAQVADISLWWLARMDEPYGPQLARIIPITGAIVAFGLFLHIVLALWDLFGWRGKFALVLLAGAAGFGGWVAYEKVINPYMSQEARPAASQE
jgi:hypothetical protein